MKGSWKKYAVAALGFAIPLLAAGQDVIETTEAAAAGLGINVPLIGRLTGAGGTLFLSTVDVTNNTAQDTQVDFYLDGADVAHGTAISRVGSISSAGTLVAQGAGGAMRHRSNAHFDDFIGALVTAGILDSSVQTDGFLGSVLFVFNGFTKRGQGAATVRFYNEFGGGTIGQALRGHEISTNEPQSLIATLRDSRSQANGPKLYANLFINNTGLTPAGATASGAVAVRLQAIAESTGQPVGTPVDLTIGAGQTASVSDALHRLGAPSGEDTILVTATVTSGSAAIAGAAVQVDNTTKDGSVVDMSRGDF